jgi:hypothetical protein
MAEFVNAVISECVVSGIGSLYATSGVSLQDGYRRETGAETIAVFRATGGVSLIFDTSEGYGFQVLVDSKTVSGARAVSRDIYNTLHNRLAEVISGYSVLWVRGVAPPQDVGPGPGTGERFAVSTNYEARILR